MTGFINSLIQRTTGATQIVLPRLRGRFERDTVYKPMDPGDDRNAFETDEQKSDAEKFPESRNRTPDPRSPLKSTVTPEPSEPRPNQLQDRPTLLLPPESRLDTTAPHEAKSPDRLETNHSVVPPQPTPDTATFAQPLKSIPTDRRQIENPAEMKDTRETGDDHAAVKERRMASGLYAAPVLPFVAPSQEGPTQAFPTKTVTESQVQSTKAPATESFRSIDRSFQDRSSSSNKPAPSVNISIGRIDLRVTAASGPAQEKPKPERAGIISLDEYLHKK